MSECLEDLANYDSPVKTNKEYSPLFAKANELNPVV